jgi:hypothetical protein
MIKPRSVIPTHYNTWELIAQDATRGGAGIEAEKGVLNQASLTFKQRKIINSIF